jgi:uncharacterized protein (TIGR03437 family)
MKKRSYRADLTLALLFAIFVGGALEPQPGQMTSTPPPGPGPCGSRTYNSGISALINRVSEWLTASIPEDPTFNQLPLSFEMNVGQSEARYQFLAMGAGHYVFLSPDSLVLDLRDDGDASSGVVEMKLPGANPKAVWESLEALPGRVNYIKGNDEARWLTNIPTYARVRYRNVYPGIDVDYYGRQEELEYDFVVQPGADPRAIRMQFTGDVTLSLEIDGALAVRHGERIVRWHRPRVHQRVAGQQRQIEGGYRLGEGGVVQFTVGAYDRSAALVIDPVVQYATFVGRGSNEASFAVTADSQGNAYVVGTTTSQEYPTSPGAVTSPAINAGTGDLTITKLNSTGSAMVYSTRIGGLGRDVARAVAVDETGNAYLVGTTTSEDFPTTTAGYQRRLAGKGQGEYALGDCFVVKLNNTGAALQYSTYLGGAQSDMCSAVAVDKAGNAYLAGLTGSSNFPVSETAYQRTFRGGGEQTHLKASDAFVAKMNAAGSALLYSTFLGGTLDDAATGIAIDGSGYAYVAGFTSSGNFPVSSGAPQRTYGGSGGSDTVVFGDAFITKVNPEGTGLAYSTLLGGRQDDVAYGVVIDAQGNAYVAGNTLSNNFPVTDQAYQKTYAGFAGTALTAAGDAFVAKLNAAGTAWVYSTYLGGGKDDAALGLAIDSAGNAHVTGYTTSTNFPVTSDARQSTYKGESMQNSVITGDAFYAHLNAAGSALVYSTYLGGFSDDLGMGVAVDSTGNVLVAGGTASADFPSTPGSYQAAFAGGQAGPNFPVGDGFLTRFGATATPPPPAGPDVTISAIASAASYAGGGVAPGEIVVLNGTNIGPDTLTTLVVNGGVVATTLAGTRVLFDGVAAPIVYALTGQTSVIVPYAVAGRARTSIVVERGTSRSAALEVPVLAAKPALFTANASGRGQGAILNENYSYNSEAVPIEKGRIVMLYGTGEGQTNPPGTDGLLASLVFPRPVLPVSVTIGGRTANVLYAGAAPGIVSGMFQMNVEVPRDTPSGNAEVIVTVGTARSPGGVTVAVR